jgi:uncharacterized membrane protein YbhN (UPF0104 family)
MARTLIILAVAVLITAAFIYLGEKVAWDVLLRFTLLQILLLCLSTFVLIFLHASGAAALLKGLGYNASPWRVLAAMLAASTVGLAGDPKLGVPARLFFYKVFAYVPVRVGAAQTAIESFLWITMMGLLLMMPGPLAGDYVLPLSIAVAALVFSGMAAVIVGPALLDRLWLIGPFFRKMEKLRGFIFSMRSAILQISPASLIAASGWFAATYVVDILTIGFLIDCLGGSMSSIAIAHAIVISYLAGVASLLPLGLGVRDVTFALLLQQGGLSADLAATIALTLRVARMLPPLALGAVMTPLVLGSKNKSG